MSNLIVGIPLLKDVRKFHFEKGKRWTIIEHILLEALAKSDWLLNDLVQSSSLPRRVVVESVIRLMRANWAEIKPGRDAIKFGATLQGKAAAMRDELPPITFPDSRYMGYLLDLVSGQLFKSSHINTTINPDQWETRTAGRNKVLIPETASVSLMSPAVWELSNTLLASDEQLIRVETRDWQPRRAIGLVNVNGKDIDGFNINPSNKLKELILNAAINFEENGSLEAVAKPHIVSLPTDMRSRIRSVNFRKSDLIIGSHEHELALTNAIGRCKHRLVIHSTFINLDKATALLPKLIRAVQRGVHVDILWGQSTNKDAQNNTRKAALELKRKIIEIGYEKEIIVHTQTSNSHSKILLYDDGGKDTYIAVIGSCNWLYSGFDSFETSIKIRDQKLVADISFELAELGRPLDNQVPRFTSELVRLGDRISKNAPAHIDTNGSGRLVLGFEHQNLILSARDEAKSRIVLISNKLGVMAKPVISALIAAGNDGGFIPEVFYSSTTGPVTGTDAAEEQLRVRSRGVEVRPVKKPRLHSKVLVWDNDNIVITSLNWLSADPSEQSPRQEIGIHMNVKGIGDQFIKQFKLAKEFEF